jgi:peroxiredoxin
VASSRQHQLVQAGSPAPAFRLKRLDGGESTLADLVAKGPVLLAFFKVTCPVCQLTFPFLERIHAAGTLPIVGISQNCPEDTTEFAAEFGVTFPLLLDEQDENFPASNAYGISSVPTMFLLEPGGCISRVAEGWSRADIESLAARAGVTAIRPEDNVPAWKAG